MAAISSKESFLLTTNEVNSSETLQAYKQLPNRQGTNAIWGCSGLFILDLASISPDTIEYLTVFDISSKVEVFWEKMAQVIPKLSSGNLQVSQMSFLVFIQQNYGLDSYIKVKTLISTGDSFLSSPKQLEKVHALFCKGKFFFQRLDIGNRRQFQAFLKAEQKKGAIPHTIYLSNIGECSCYNPNPGPQEPIYQRYREIAHALELLPKTAFIIDAITPTKKGYPLQRIHTDLSSEFLLLPLPPAAFLEDALLKDEYKDVCYLIDRKCDPNQKIEGMNLSYLMLMAGNGHVNSMRAFLDYNVDVSAEAKGKTALICATLEGRTRVIELLISRKADLEQRDQDQRTALHVGVIQGHIRTVETLLDLGSDRTAQDCDHLTPVDYLTDEGWSELPIRTGPRPLFNQMKKLLRPFPSPTIKHATLTPNASLVSSSLSYLGKLTITDSLLSHLANSEPQPRQPNPMPSLVDLKADVDLKIPLDESLAVHHLLSYK